MCTHETRDNPQTQSLSPDSRTVRTFAFSQPLQYMMGVVVLETTMSVLYVLTPYDSNTISLTPDRPELYTTTHALFPLFLSTSPRLTRKVTSLVRMLPTLDLNCQENTERRKWNRPSPVVETTVVLDFIMKR